MKKKIISALLALFMLVPAFAMQYISQMIFTAAGIDPTLSLWVFEITLFSILFFIMFGPANKHTANDNTSGVTALLDLMIAMPEELRAYAAFVFFDCEETGLVGSSAFAKKHKEAHLKPLVNFDCVSDGNHILFAMRKDAVTYASMLKEAFPENESCKVEILSKGVFYPSDQAKFKKGIGVAALKKSKHGGILYMDRIHTKRDTVYREENIDFLTKGAIRLTEIMANT